MGGKFEKSNMMQDSTVYRMDELEEDEEEPSEETLTVP